MHDDVISFLFGFDSFLWLTPRGGGGGGSPKQTKSRTVVCVWYYSNTVIIYSYTALRLTRLSLFSMLLRTYTPLRTGVRTTRTRKESVQLLAFRPKNHHYSYSQKRTRTMLVLSESQVRQALDLQECLHVNRHALQAVADHSAQVPTRIGLEYYKQQPNRTHQSTATSTTTTTNSTPDWTLFKPASLLSSTSAEGKEETLQMGMKVVSIRDGNAARGLPTVPATVLHLEPSTGMVDAIVSSTYLTAARTAAGSAWSVALCQPVLQHLVLFGAGLQAELHIRMIELVTQQRIPRITIINRNLERAQQLKDMILQEQQASDRNASSRTTTAATSTSSVLEIVSLHDKVQVAEALSTADVCVTATNATTPLFEGYSLLKPHCHVCSVGSYTPNMQEIATTTVDRCHTIYIDTPEAMQVGDLKHLLPLETSTTTTQRSIQLLGDALQNETGTTANARLSPMRDLTFYKSVGTAIQDVMTADVVVRRARELQLGTEVDMS